MAIGVEKPARRRLLAEVQVPVRILRGERDHLAPQKWTEYLAGVAGAPAPTIVPKWGHMVHYDDPQSVADVVMDLAKAVPHGAAVHFTADSALER